MTATRGGARLSTPQERTSEHIRDRVRAVLEAQLACVDSSQTATLVVHHAREADGMNDAALAETVSDAPGSAVDRIAAAGRGQSTAVRVAAILVETARQAFPPTQEASAVAEAAYDVLGFGTDRVAPTVEHGRTLLRHAAVRDLGLRERGEARLFLVLSSLPHPIVPAVSIVGRAASGIGPSSSDSRRSEPQPCYLGAHDPDEVLAGSLLGIALAEVLRYPTGRVLADINLPDTPRTRTLTTQRRVG